MFLLLCATETGWQIAQALGAQYRHFFYLFSSGRTWMYYDEADWRDIADAYFSKITTVAALGALIAGSKLKQAPRLYSAEDLRAIPLEQHAQLVQTVAREMVEAFGASHAIEGITYGAEARLKAAIAERGEYRELDFSLLCTPTTPSFALEIQRALWNMRDLSGNEQKVAAEAFILDHGWSDATYQGYVPPTVDQVIRRALEMKEVTAIDAQKTREDKESLMSKLSFSAEERFIVETIDRCFAWQDDRKQAILRWISRFDVVLVELAHRLNISAEAIKYAIPAELNLAHLQDVAFQVLLDERKRGSAYYTLPAEDLVFTGEDYRYLARHLEVQFDEAARSLKGVVASQGVVRGVVRVCQSISSIDRVQTGEVLVASMTRPEYLPAMQRASAFITDEGGITCHAAIISREMRKPCIIGTKVATKLLKDGDMVEVDGNSGLVTLLTT
jgi:phosphohistidine swiveling domain-containing protein